MGLIYRIVFILSFAVGISAQAHVDLTTTQAWPLNTITVTPQNAVARNASIILPTDIPPTEDFNQVMGYIADHNLQEKMKTDFIFLSKTRAEPDQRFTFKFAAFENLAKFEYAGRFQFNVNCSTIAPNADFSLSERIWNNKSLTVTHSIISRTSSNTFGLGWAF